MQADKLLMPPEKINNCFYVIKKNKLLQLLKIWLLQLINHKKKNKKYEDVVIKSIIPNKPRTRP